MISIIKIKIYRFLKVYRSENALKCSKFSRCARYLPLEICILARRRQKILVFFTKQRKNPSIFSISETYFVLKKSYISILKRISYVGFYMKTVK